MHSHTDLDNKILIWFLMLQAKKWGLVNIAHKQKIMDHQFVLFVPERFADPAAVGAEEVVRHVRVEV